MDDTRKKFSGMTFGEERALYGVYGADIVNCAFMGEEDGESALKEAADLNVVNTKFLLRYPLWHVDKATLQGCCMADTCRAALWYASDVTVKDCVLAGVKAVRECDNVTIRSCNITSSEFGWFCRGLNIENSTLNSEYPFLKTEGITLSDFTLNGKYSFQYVKNVTIKNSVLNTKDAFWHAENVTVTDSVVRGEYLGWYSKNLKLIRCKIVGTQPLCYAKGLVLEDCTTEECDLAFELSDVTATVKGNIVSVKNPRSGSIECDSVGAVVMDDPRAEGVVKIR